VEFPQTEIAGELYHDRVEQEEFHKTEIKDRKI
jgi:hypothetical protein